jgi:histidine ammonia-lyase
VNRLQPHQKQQQRHPSAKTHARWLKLRMRGGLRAVIMREMMEAVQRVELEQQLEL